MLAIGESIIDESYRQYGNGYDQSDDDYVVYYKIATKFCHKARFEDRDDLLHTIILNFAIATGATDISLTILHGCIG